MDLETVSATEFKAKCLDLLNQVGARQIERLEITKRGKVVAVLIPPTSQADAVQRLHGFLRGSVVVPSGVDLTASSLDDPLDAARGELHR
jgi:prevent-host-death family protein